MSRSKYKNPNTPIFWDKLMVTKTTELFDSPIYQHKNRIVVKYLTGIKGKLLDVGAGYGYVEKIIVERRLDLELYGIDISKVSINKLTKNYGNNFKIGKVSKIPFSDSVFDCVLLLDVIEHTPKSENQTIYKEIKRVLKKDGFLVVSVPINESKSDTLRNGHLRSYNPIIIENEIKQNGFEVVNKVNLYAFRKFYFIKNIFVNLFKSQNKWKPNLTIIKAQKK